MQGYSESVGRGTTSVGAGEGKGGGVSVGGSDGNGSRVDAGGSDGKGSFEGRGGTVDVGRGVGMGRKVAAAFGTSVARIGGVGEPAGVGTGVTVACGAAGCGFWPPVQAITPIAMATSSAPVHALTIVRFGSDLAAVTTLSFRSVSRASAASQPLAESETNVIRPFRSICLGARAPHLPPTLDDRAAGQNSRQR
jgi:hypothetical protein